MTLLERIRKAFRDDAGDWTVADDYYDPPLGKIKTQPTVLVALVGKTGGEGAVRKLAEVVVLVHRKQKEDPFERVEVVMDAAECVLDTVCLPNLNPVNIERDWQFESGGQRYIAIVFLVEAANDG